MNICQEENLVTILQAIKLNIRPIVGLKLYLEEIFEDLITRSPESMKILSLSKFHRYIKLPLFVSKKIFAALDVDNKNYLTKEEFSGGIFDLFAGTISRRLGLFFSILDFDKDGILLTDDISIILKHLHMIHNFGDISLLDRLITDTFGEQKKISYSCWMTINKSNSDLFLMFLFSLYHNKPFHEENVMFYINNKRKKVEKVSVSSSGKKSYVNESTSADDFSDNLSPQHFLENPSELLFSYLNTNYKSQLEFQYPDDDIDNDILLLDNFEEDKIVTTTFFETEGSLNSIQNDTKYTESEAVKTENSKLGESSIFNFRPFFKKKASTCEPKKKEELISNYKQRDSLLFNHSNAQVLGNSKIYSNPNFSLPDFQSLKKEIDAYHIHKGNTLKKCRLVLLNDDIFIFKYYKGTTKTKLKKIFQIKSSFADRCESVKINGKFYYSFHIDSNDSFQPHLTLFFVEKEEDMCNWVESIREASNYRNVVDFYSISGEARHGEYGMVHKAINKKTGEEVAIKCLEKKNIRDDSIGMVEWELDIFNFLISANHPGIIKAKEKFESQNSIYLVYEYVQEGDLDTYLSLRKDILTGPELMRLAFQLSDSLCYLNQFGIIHRDLKPANILYARNTKDYIQLKLIDFGLSTVLGYHEKTAESFGSLHYAAPEVLLNNHYDHKVDVWSLGVILYFMKFAKLPFDDQISDIQAIYNKIISGEYHMKGQTKNNEYDIILGKVILSCLQTNPQKRYNCKEILKLVNMD